MPLTAKYLLCLSLACLSLFVIVTAGAQVPALLPISDDLREPERSKLVTDYDLLKSRLAKLQIEGTKFNQECGNVKAGSVKDAECARRNGQLERLRLDYVADVHAFNDRVRRARIGDNPQCVKHAGEQLQRDQQQGCARVVGTCFTNNKTQLSATAVGCVAACRQLAGCAIGCGIAGLAAENVVARCVDEGNSCFETALARHKQAVEACK